jgi:hypothetical protein
MLTISPTSAAVKRYYEELAQYLEREVDLLAAVGVDSTS